MKPSVTSSSPSSASREAPRDPDIQSHTADRRRAGDTAASTSVAAGTVEPARADKPRDLAVPSGSHSGEASSSSGLKMTRDGFKLPPREGLPAVPTSPDTGESSLEPRLSGIQIRDPGQERVAAEKKPMVTEQEQVAVISSSETGGSTRRAGDSDQKRLTENRTLVANTVKKAEIFLALSSAPTSPRGVVGAGSTASSVFGIEEADASSIEPVLRGSMREFREPPLTWLHNQRMGVIDSAPLLRNRPSLSAHEASNGEIIQTLYGAKSMSSPVSATERTWKSFLANLPGAMVSNLLSFGAANAVATAGAEAIIKSWFPNLTPELRKEYAEVFGALVAGCIYPISNALGARINSALGAEIFVPDPHKSKREKELRMAMVNAAGTAVFPLPHFIWAAMAEKDLIPEGLDQYGWAVKGPVGTALMVAVTQLLEAFLASNGHYIHGGGVVPTEVIKVLKDGKNTEENAKLSVAGKIATTFVGTLTKGMSRGVNDMILTWTYFAVYLYPRGVKGSPLEEIKEKEEKMLELERELEEERKIENERQERRPNILS